VRGKAKELKKSKSYQVDVKAMVNVMVHRHERTRDRRASSIAGVTTSGNSSSGRASQVVVISTPSAAERKAEGMTGNALLTAESTGWKEHRDSLSLEMTSI